MLPEHQSRARAADLVSRETLERLDSYIAELTRWQRIKNLVGPDTLDHVWTRHILDSLQLRAVAPLGQRWLDLGSGAGLPGLILAIADPDARLHLVESNGRKCAFLRHVARTLAPNAQVHQARIEDVVPRLAGEIDIVTARALAALPQLLAWSESVLRNGAQALFPKGREVKQELTLARESWRFQADMLPSWTDPAARILRITSFEGALGNVG